jgi:sugar lactone lactonase YvrE
MVYRLTTGPALRVCGLVEVANQAVRPTFVTLPLTGDWQQVTTVFNANGIAQTPNRKALLVVNSTTGLLYRVDPQTGVATKVDLGGSSLTAGDGLLVRGRTLYVVRNQLNKVAVIKLNASGTRGRLVDTLTSKDFDTPTTVAAFGKSLYLPNARFTTPPTPDTPYWITRIDRR